MKKKKKNSGKHFGLRTGLHLLPSRNRDGKSPSGEMTTGPSGKAFPS